METTCGRQYRFSINNMFEQLTSHLPFGIDIPKDNQVVLTHATEVIPSLCSTIME